MRAYDRTIAPIEEDVPDETAPPLDMRRTDLWEGVPPQDMWKLYRDDMLRQIDDLYRPDRVRAVAQIRESVPTEPKVA